MDLEESVIPKKPSKRYVKRESAKFIGDISMPKKDRVLPPIHPNAGLKVEYRARLDAVIEQMTRSYARWIVAQYRKTPPRIAMDATPAKELEKEIRNLGKKWNKHFDEMAPKLARWFLQSAAKRSEARLKKILKDGGMSVEFKMTPVVRDIVEASIADNVALIKSIASQYHTQIEGLVMRSVTTGRDLGYLSKELQKRYGVTKRRAAFIARDQNNKATAVVTRARQQEIGIEEAVWLHSHGGNEPRPTHLANSGERYRVSEGWFDPDPKVRRHIWPGELINCRCVSKPVIKGFS